MTDTTHSDSAGKSGFKTVLFRPEATALFLVRPLEPCHALSHAQRYLLTRSKAAETLGGLPGLRRWYRAGYFALKLWRLEQRHTSAKRSTHV
jgi:hypothetical protein